MRNVLFQFVCIQQPVHVKESFAEIPPVQLLSKDGFIKALKLAQRKFLVKHVKYDGLIVDPALQLPDTGIQDFFMIESQGADLTNRVPVQLVVVKLKIVVPDIYQ